MGITKGMMSSKTPEWSTPQNLFDELNAEFHFTLDPCATKENAKCKKFFTKEDNGLENTWSGERVFCNPPYGREISNWVHKCRIYGTPLNPVVALLPARTDTNWFHEDVYGRSEIRFLRGRLKFGDSKNSAPFPSMVVVFSGQKKKK